MRISDRAGREGGSGWWRVAVVAGAFLISIVVGWLPGATAGADAAVIAPSAIMQTPLAERVSSGRVSLVDMERVGAPSSVSSENRDLEAVPSGLGGPRVGRVDCDRGFESGMSFLVIPGREGWGVTSYRAAGGSYSAYCAQSILPAPGPYPNSMYTQMQAAAFKLPNVGTATLEFDMYLDTQSGHDLFGLLLGPNGEDGYLWLWDGSSGGWVHVMLDLTRIPLEEGGYASMLGTSMFGIDFIFASDGATRKEGVYVDNVRLIVTTTPCLSYRGTDRYDTAVKLSKAIYPAALAAGSGLVLAPGETFQEALCGAPLAAAWGGPVLLTYQTALANNVKAELQRLLPSEVFCIGMAPAVVTAVQAALPSAMVTAINGDANNAYDMSYRVAKALGDKVGDMSLAVAIVTVGTNFPDAIGVSPLACAKLWPILLTDRGDGSPVHIKAASAMSELGITQAIKVGTYANLGTVTGLAQLSGGDRYYTCANVATWAKASAGLSFASTAIATGDKFPDALASGPYLAKDQGILLLSPLYGPLPVPIGTVITANRGAVEETTFIACIEPVIGQVRALLL